MYLSKISIKDFRMFSNAVEVSFLDSVLFVSSYAKSDSSSGAHWRDWFQYNEEGLNEAHRLAYVAFSRAKHLLALGIPNPPSAPLNEADKQMLIDCGFEIVELA